MEAQPKTSPRIPGGAQSARRGFIDCDEEIAAFKKAHFNFGRGNSAFDPPCVTPAYLFYYL